MELIDRLQKRSGERFLYREGSVYPALRSLEREGLIESYESEPLPERRGRPRRYYKLTAQGSAAAQDQRHGLIAVLSPVEGVPA